MRPPVLPDLSFSLRKTFYIMKLPILFLGLNLSAGAIFNPLPPRTSPSNIVTRTVYENRCISTLDDASAILDITSIEAILENFPRGVRSSHTPTSTLPKPLVWPPKNQDLPNLILRPRAAPHSFSMESQVRSLRALDLHDFDLVQTTTTKHTGAMSVTTASLTLKLTVLPSTTESAVQTLTLNPTDPSSCDSGSYDFDISATGYFVMSMNDTELHVPFPMPVAASLCKRITGCLPKKKKSSSLRISSSNSYTDMNLASRSTSGVRLTSTQIEKRVTNLQTAIMSSMVTTSAPKSTSTSKSNTLQEPSNPTPHSYSVLLVTVTFLATTPITTTSCQRPNPDPTSVQLPIPPPTSPSSKTAAVPRFRARRVLTIANGRRSRTVVSMAVPNEEDENVLVRHEVLPSHKLPSPTSTSPTSTPNSSIFPPMPSVSSRHPVSSPTLEPRPPLTPSPTSPHFPNLLLTLNRNSSTSDAVAVQRMDQSFLPYWGYPMIGIYFLTAAWQFVRGLRGCEDFWCFGWGD